MTDTTNLDNLPITPNLKDDANITLETNEKKVSFQQPAMDTFASSLQEASSAGMTSLPSRDIPMNPSMVNSDVQTQPNYINNGNNVDYIQNHQTNQSIQQQQQQTVQKQDTFDTLFNEYHALILIGILYFMFQLPYVKNVFKQLFPTLYNESGKMETTGHLFISISFALSYYIITKGIISFAQS